jgi:hypothetical protein
MSAEVQGQSLELFRVALLRVLALNNTRWGVPVDAVIHHCVQFAFRPTREQVVAELTYLVDKGLVAEVPRVISPENSCWRITAAGRDFLAQS